MKIRNQRVTRRQALARLGLAAGAAYAAPALIGLSRAHAASSASAASAASAASPASPASAASPASSASPASTPSGAELPEGENKADGCTLGTVPEHATISQTDMRNAQRAIDRGNAMPLRQVVAKVKKRHPGRLINVGFSEQSGRPIYQLKMVSSGGAVQTVTVNAGSGRIAGVSGC